MKIDNQQSDANTGNRSMNQSPKVKQYLKTQQNIWDRFVSLQPLVMLGEQFL